MSANKMSNKQKETQASNPWFRTCFYESILGERSIEEFKGVLVEIGKVAGISQHQDTRVVVKGPKITLECLCDLTARNI